MNTLITRTLTLVTKKSISKIRRASSSAENCLKKFLIDTAAGTVKIHPNAPFRQQSRRLKMLRKESNATRLLEMCTAAKQSPGNFSVLMINSRVKPFSQRETFHET